MAEVSTVHGLLEVGSVRKREKIQMGCLTYLRLFALKNKMQNISYLKRKKKIKKKEFRKMSH